MSETETTAMGATRECPAGAPATAQGQWDRPVIVEDGETAFGGRDMRRLLPPWEMIPEVFRLGRGEWNDLFSQWFFNGLPEQTTFVPVAGVNAGQAVRHLRAIMRSFEPKHEHKEAGCAYLMSKWFEQVLLDGPTL